MDKIDETGLALIASVLLIHGLYLVFPNHFNFSLSTKSVGLLLICLGSIILLIIIVVKIVHKKKALNSCKSGNKSSTWYSEDIGQRLNKKILISLYTRYHENMGEAINRHFNVRNYYTTLLSALFGLYVVGFTTLINNKPPVEFRLGLNLVSVSTPLLIVVLSIFAIKSTTRYYVVFLRMVVLVTKIENVLGADYKIRTDMRKPKNLAWKGDRNFMDQDYLDSRKGYNTSKEFIEKKKYKGDNQWAFWTFFCFFMLGIFLCHLPISGILVK